MRNATGLVTVIGEAGVGKSRLVEEFLRERPEGVAVIRGRCLPYGEGITYWPLKEAIAEAAGLDAGDSAAVARERIRGLVASSADADLIVERIAEAIGIAEVVPEHRGPPGGPPALRGGDPSAPARRRLRRYPVGRG